MTDLVVLGSYVQDHVFVTERAPERGETVLGRFATVPGGKGFNQAIAAHRQGVRVAFLGAIGRDALGDTARSYAAADSLPTHWQTIDHAATGAAGIVVDARGDNRIVVALGANLELSTDFVASQAALMRSARVLLVQFENALATIEAALSLAREAGVVTVLNPAPMNPRASSSLFALADVITPNESEFAQLAVLRGLAEADVAAARDAAQLDHARLHALCRRVHDGTLVVTLGEHGAFVSHGARTRHGDDATCYRVAPEPVRAVDTTGAGDAFSGALAAMLAQGLAFGACIAQANRVAALSTETEGAAPSMPTRAEVERRFG